MAATSGPGNKPDAFDMYYYATCYKKSAVRLSEQQQKMPYKAPIVVFQALALEIFFKCIYRSRDLDIPRGHDLKKLFTGLSEADRAAIFDRFVRPVMQVDGSEQQLDLIAVLDRCKSLFEVVRYGYEGKLPEDAAAVPVNLGLPPAINAVQGLILRDNPSFAERAEAIHALR